MWHLITVNLMYHITAQRATYLCVSGCLCSNMTKWVRLIQDVCATCNAVHSIEMDWKVIDQIDRQTYSWLTAFCSCSFGPNSISPHCSRQLTEGWQERERERERDWTTVAATDPLRTRGARSTRWAKITQSDSNILKHVTNFLLQCLAVRYFICGFVEYCFSVLM